MLQIMLSAKESTSSSDTREYLHAVNKDTALLDYGNRERRASGRQERVRGKSRTNAELYPIGLAPEEKCQECQAPARVLLP